MSELSVVRSFKDISIPTHVVEYKQLSNGRVVREVTELEDDQIDKAKCFTGMGLYHIPPSGVLTEEELGWTDLNWQYGYARYDYMVRLTPQISMNQLLGRQVQDRKTTSNLNPVSFDIPISDKPMSFVAIDRPSLHSTEYLGFTKMQSRADDISRVLFSIGPNKHYGLDILDAISDWGRMLNVSNSSDQRLYNRHLAYLGPHWLTFINIHGRFLRNLLINSRSQILDDRDFVVPVMRWGINHETGEKDWFLGRNFGDPYRTLSYRFLRNNFKGPIPRNLLWDNNLVGFYKLAHECEDAISIWPKTRGYKLDSHGGFLRDNGFTQVVVHAIEVSGDLLYEEPVLKAEDYIEATAVPIKV